MNSGKAVLVFCEAGDSKLSKIATEILGGGKLLADELNVSLIAVIAGTKVEAAAAEAISLGADKVYKLEGALLADYTNDVYAKVLGEIVEAVQPQIVLLGQTAIGRDLAPSIAFMLHTGVVMDCVGLEIDPESQRMLLTKPVYGGNIMGVSTISTDPQIATIRAKSMQAATADQSRQGEVTAWDCQIDSSTLRVKFLEKIPEQLDGLRLEDARVVVAGGRGIGGKPEFEQLETLADLLGGTVGVSRAVCDNGWMPVSKQVGLTGKIVSPEVYFAIAISGASQHMAGCSGARNIIAINNDNEARIFKVADYGVMGDWKDVLPGFVNKLRELKAC